MVCRKTCYYIDAANILNPLSWMQGSLNKILFHSWVSMMSQRLVSILNSICLFIRNMETPCYNVVNFVGNFCQFVKAKVFCPRYRSRYVDLHVSMHCCFYLAWNCKALFDLLKQSLLHAALGVWDGEEWSLRIKHSPIHPFTFIFDLIISYCKIL